MLAIDHPTADDSPVDYGTFVVVALDPVASVADLRDEDATRQALCITPTRCLAIVNSFGELVLSPKAGGLVLSRNFQLVGRGLPDPPCSWAAIPIAPAPAHPETHRPAVLPSAPLPWEDCHIHCMAQHTARVSRIYQSPNPGPFFPSDEYSEISLTIEEDRARSDCNSEVSVPSSVSYHGSAAGTDYGQNVRPENPQSFDETRAMRELFPGLVDRGLPEVNFYVQMWVDINAAGELGRPEDFFQEGRKIKEIEQQWADRVVRDIRSKRPQTTAWLEGLTGADAPDGVEYNIRYALEPEDDGIAPEDAIEHRIERATVVRPNMLSIDHPNALDCPVDLGTFVVIALDLEASVEDLCDEDVTRQVHSITPVRCLAIVNSIGEFVFSPKAGGRVLSRSFQLVGHGLPDPPHSLSAIPIFPAPEHPQTHRPPVRASAPLPWDDCHIYCMARHMARVSRIYQSPHSGPSFPMDEYSEIRIAIEEDRAGSDSSSELSEVSSLTGADNGQRAPLRGSEAFDERRAMKELFPGLVDVGLPEVKFHVQLWVDITSAGELGRPEAFLEQCRLIKDIEEKWADRVVAYLRSKRPQTSAWLAGVTGADAPDAENDQNVVVEDESIMPEDAIEHRIARAIADEAAAPANDAAQSSSHEVPTPIVSEAFIKSPRNLVSVTTPSITGSADTSRANVSDGPSECPADKSVHAYGLRQVLYRALFVFRGLYYSFRSLAARSRSFVWRLLWRKPFSE